MLENGFSDPSLDRDERFACLSDPTDEDLEPVNEMKTS